MKIPTIKKCIVKGCENPRARNGKTNKCRRHTNLAYAASKKRKNIAAASTLSELVK